MVNWYKKHILPRFLSKEMGKKEFEKIRQEVVMLASGVVLDVGAGPGYNFPFYKNVSKVFALDSSKELIEIAKQKTTGLKFLVEFLQEEAEHISLPNQSIDAVVSTWTLCSVKDPKKVLGEMKRVLKPQGKFVFIDHGASSNFFIKVLQSLHTLISKYFSGNCHLDRKISRLIEDAGFVIEKIVHPHPRFRPLIYYYQGAATLK